MSILEKLGAKPTPLSQAKQNIDSLEREVNEVLRQLGKDFYEAFKRGEIEKSTPFLPVLNKLSQMEANYKAYQDNYLSLQGKMECKNCYSIIPFGSVFCANCGCKTSSKEIENEVARPQLEVCSRCGNQVFSGMAFCKHCGFQLQK